MIGLDRQERMRLLESTADQMLRKVIFECSMRTGFDQLGVVRVCLALLTDFARTLSPQGTAQLLRALADRAEQESTADEPSKAAVTEAISAASERMQDDLALHMAGPRGRA